MEEAELPDLPVEMLTEILLRVSTPANLVHAAATSKRWREAAVARPDFLASYRDRQPSSTFLGIYVSQFGRPPSFHMPDSIRLGKDDVRDLKDAASKAYFFGDIRRYQDHRRHVDDNTFIERLELHPDCRVLDCHNSRLLLTRGDEALEVRSPLARESIVIPFPPDVADPKCLQACLLHGHDKAAVASFRVVCLQHRRPPRSRWQARAVEYDSRRKSWQDHRWETITDIEGKPEKVMHAGHRIFCKYRGVTSAALVLDTDNIQFSTLHLPNHQNFAIGEIQDNVCCFVETHGCTDHRLKVWQLDREGENLHWDLKKDVEMNQVIGEHLGFYHPRAISNGILLLCSSTRDRHFVVDLKTFSMKEEFEFQGQSAYPMQMPWPPIFSANAAGGFDRDREPASVGTPSCGLSKEKKRERGEQGIDPAKRDRDHLHVDDSEPGSKLDNIRSEIAKVEKGGLPNTEAVEKPVHLMQLDQTVQRVDLALAKLPINLSALQSCSIGKSVNHLRSHKNLEIKGTAVSEEGDNSPCAMLDENNSRPPDDSVKDAHASRIVCSASSYMNEKGVCSSETMVGNSFSPMNPLIEIKYSEASHSLHAGDDTSMDLLASVAGKISKSELVSPSASPRNSSAKKLGCKGDNAGKVTVESNVGPSQDPGPADAKKVVGRKEVKSDSCLAAKEEQRQTVPSPKLADSKAVGSSVKTKIHQGRANKCNSQPDSVDSKGENQDECRHQGRKRAGSKQSKRSLKAMDPRTRNWKWKWYLIKPISQRKRHLLSIASKISDEVQTATSSCREASAASTVAVSTGDCKLLLGGSDSTYKSTDAGKQSIIDVSITSAPSLSDPSVGESAGQRGEAAQDSDEPQYLDIQDPTATHTSAAAQQCFGKDKNYVPNDYLISEICDEFSDLNPKGGAAVEPEEPLVWRSQSPFCVQNLDNDLLLQAPALASCPLQGRKRADSRESKSPEAKGPGRHNWKQKPKFLEALFASRKVFKNKEIALRKQKPKFLEPKFSDLVNTKAAATAALQEEMKALVASISDDAGAAFTAMQLQELEQQSRVYQYMVARVPVPTHLVFPVWKSVTGASSEGAQKYPTLMGLATLCLDFGKNPEPEPGRCRRTDGKKWRCCRSTIPNEKFCERHMHRGRKRPVQVVVEDDKPDSASGSKYVEAIFASRSSISSKRCRRTDGKKWRCCRSTIPNEKYCKRHMHFGRKRPVQVVVEDDKPDSASRSKYMEAIFASRSSISSKRCRRTDGKKWQCCRSTIPNEKYCERHMHFGRKRPVQVVVEDDKPDSASGSKYVEAIFASRSSISSKRCRRTDGKKWRCCRSTIPNEKYWERHMHFGRKRQVVVEDDKPDSASGSKYVEAIFASRSSISSKSSDEVQIAISSCREASATSTAALGSTIKFTDSGKQPIIDVSITSAPSPEARENNQSLLAEQRGEAARGKGSPEAMGRAKRRKKLNTKYMGGDWAASTL